MAFGALQRSSSYRQLWRRPVNHAPRAGAGTASLVLGSDARDESAVLQAGNRIRVTSDAGVINDTRFFYWLGTLRLNEAPPTGYGWRVTLTIGGLSSWSDTYDFGADELSGLNFPLTIDLNDLAHNVTGVAGNFGLEVTLTLYDDGGGAGVDVPCVLPSLYLDQITAPVTSSDLVLINRYPQPEQISVSPDIEAFSFFVADTTGNGIDTANTTITVDGVTAFAGGVSLNGFVVAVSAAQGLTGDDAKFVVDFPVATDFVSEQAVTVQVQSQNVPGTETIDETYTFTIADTIAPSVQTASMIDVDVLRLTFNDTMSPAQLLTASNYTIARTTAPAVPLTVIAAAAVPGDATAVDLTFQWDASPGAGYTLTAQNVTDERFNVIDPNGQEITFNGFVCDRPAGRRFELLDFIPEMNIREDDPGTEADPRGGTGDLRKFMLVLQDVVEVLLCSIDRWTSIIDIDKAPIEFVEAILQDLGDPFEACIPDLTENDKRKLARILISIYKQKGTDQGIINAVRFFLDIEVTLDVLNFRPYWQLDVSLLGTSTTISPSVGSPLWYSFYIVSPVVLTDEQRERILCIADYMKAAHEHVLGVIEPGGIVTPSTYWFLNLSALGADPAVLDSTILAP